MKYSDKKPPTAEELQNELNELLENVRVLQQLRQHFFHANNDEMICGTENEHVNLHQLFKWTRSGNLAKCVFCGLKINRSARQSNLRLYGHLYNAHPETYALFQIQKVLAQLEHQAD
uniref:BED-type domain-containing protein n=1 Tax=Globodera pallida TaxID=36090 RepID=A0A183BKF9_GLOPA